MTCKDCIMFTHCRYDLNGNGEPCENFKNKADIIEPHNNAIIFVKDKWLMLNMESQDLGKAIKTCIDYLTKNARAGDTE